MIETMTGILTIKQFAALAGVNVTTVRFYERKGLLREPERASSGYRNYANEDLTRIRFIRRAHDLGFTLSEIHELLEIRDDQESCAQVQDLVARRLKKIERQLASLRAVKEALFEHQRQCSNGNSTGCCPLIKALQGEDDEEVMKPARRARKPRGEVAQ